MLERPGCGGRGQSAHRRPRSDPGANDNRQLVPLVDRIGVLSLPFPLRYLLATRLELITQVLGIDYPEGIVAIKY